MDFKELTNLFTNALSAPGQVADSVSKTSAEVNKSVQEIKEGAVAYAGLSLALSTVMAVSSAIVAYCALTQMSRKKRR